MSKDLEILKADVKKLMLKDWTEEEIDKLSEFMEDVIIATMLSNGLKVHVVLDQDGEDVSELKECMAGRDGECNHPKCPISEEDEANGVFCELPLHDHRIN